MCAVTVCNITIHALVMTLVVHVARAADKKRTTRPSLRLAGPRRRRQRHAGWRGWRQPADRRAADRRAGRDDRRHRPRLIPLQRPQRGRRYDRRLRTRRRQVQHRQGGLRNPGQHRPLSFTNEFFVSSASPAANKAHGQFLYDADTGGLFWERQRGGRTEADRNA